MTSYRVYLCGVDPRMEIPNPECSNAAQHTPSPRGYLEWHEWAEETAKTHVPKQCPACLRWVLHEPIGGAA